MVQENNRNIDIYSKLYDLTNYNLSKSDNGQKLKLTKEVFLYMIRKSKSEVDINKLSKLNSMDFVTASYLMYFNRMPDEKASEYWELRLKELDFQFKSEVTNALLNSPEFEIKGPKIINNIYENNNMSRKSSKLFRGVLYRVYRVLPEMIKKYIRKCIGKHY